MVEFHLFSNSNLFLFFVFNQCSSIFSCLCITLFDNVSFDAAGFLSIDCGVQTNYSAENNIQWVTDVNYIYIGETTYTGDTTQQAYDSSCIVYSFSEPSQEILLSVSCDTQCALPLKVMVCHRKLHGISKVNNLRFLSLLRPWVCWLWKPYQ